VSDTMSAVLLCPRTLTSSCSRSSLGTTALRVRVMKCACLSCLCVVCIVPCFVTTLSFLAGLYFVAGVCGVLFGLGVCELLSIPSTTKLIAHCKSGRLVVCDVFVSSSLFVSLFRSLYADH
jgi:hypothetical protein